MSDEQAKAHAVFGWRCKGDQHSNECVWATELIRNERLAARARVAELTGALERWKCPLCNGAGRVPAWRYDAGANGGETACRTCSGDGLHPVARAALARPSTGGGATPPCLDPCGVCASCSAGPHAADPGRLDPVEAIRETPCPDKHGDRACITQGIGPGDANFERGGYFCAARLRAAIPATRGQGTAAPHIGSPRGAGTGMEPGQRCTKRLAFHRQGHEHKVWDNEYWALPLGENRSFDDRCPYVEPSPTKDGGKP